jgi:hypothetical protein
VSASPSNRTRWLAPAIVTLVAIVGAHPFCNLMFHCGCGLVSLTAHCNIHHAMPPHCPWCAQPRWFLLAGALGWIGATVAMRLARRRSPALLPSLAAGLVGVVAGGALGAVITRALT